MNGQHGWASAGRDNNVSCRQGAAVNLHSIGGGDLCLTLDAIHSEPRVAVYRVVWFHLPDYALDPFHYTGEVEVNAC